MCKNNKPNFTQIFPAASSIIAQLNTIRAIIPSTIDMFQKTGDPYAIQPNLNMIELAIKHLRGEEFDCSKPITPIDRLRPAFTAPAGVDIEYRLNSKREYIVDITGKDIEPSIEHPTLFPGQIGEVSEIIFKIPLTCGKTYMVTQVNDALGLYKEDDSINFDEEVGTWVKKKSYKIDTDFFEYAFLVAGGRSCIEITIESPDMMEPIVFFINAHIHFKKKEEDKA